MENFNRKLNGNYRISKCNISELEGRPVEKYSSSNREKKNGEKQSSI